MSTTGESGVSWVCPQCSRRVPMRVDTCRCGTPKPALAAPPAVAPAPAPGTTAQTVAMAPHSATLPGAQSFPSVAATFDDGLRTPNERTLFVVGLIFSGLFWLALLFTIVGIFHGLLGLLFSLIVHALFLAHIRGNSLRVSEQQLPEIHAAVVRASRALGLPEVPEVYVSQAGGVLNAFATKFLTRKFVIIYSDLVEACHDPRQLEFVIGHEVGHLAAGHLKWNAVLWPFMLVPLLGMAYSRAREYTCDRCGLAVVNDPEASMRGLIVLAAGGKQAARADVGAFMQQRLETGGFWSAVVELGSTHPYLCKRVSALQEFVQPGSAPPVPRNPLAYPLAPFFAFGAVGGAGASMLIVVAIIGVIAAIAIPSLLRARVAANEAAAIGVVGSVVSAEATFAQVAGVYGPMPCLVSPRGCLGQSYQGPSFLDASAAQEVQAGYRHTLRVTSDGSNFVHVAEPVQPGRTGIRSFCGDRSGILCASSEPGLLEASASGCDRSHCRPIR